nr:MAG TPA: hypothetical protein [Bacteriophage sp.]DAX04699.1 MAG TPA: hypothetical protein [Bacteriophage sp.]
MKIHLVTYGNTQMMLLACMVMVIELGINL